MRLPGHGCSPGALWNASSSRSVIPTFAML
jgi:hypothetical protein